MLVSEDFWIKYKLQKSLNSKRNSSLISEQITQLCQKELEGIKIVDNYSTGELSKQDDAELKSILEVFIPEAGLAMK